MEPLERDLAALFPNLLSEKKTQGHLAIASERWTKWRSGDLLPREPIKGGSRPYFNCVMKALHDPDSTAAAPLYMLAVVERGVAALKRHGISPGRIVHRLCEVEAEYHTSLFELRVAAAIDCAASGGELSHEVHSPQGNMNADFGLTCGNSLVAFEAKWRDDSAFGNVAPYFHEALVDSSIRARKAGGVDCGFHVHVAENSPNAKQLIELEEYFAAAIAASDPATIVDTIRPVTLQRAGQDEKGWIAKGGRRLMFPIGGPSLIRWIEADLSGSGILVASAGSSRPAQRGWHEQENGSKPAHADGIANLVAKAARQIGETNPGAIVVGFDDEDALDELEQAILDSLGLMRDGTIGPNIAVIGVAQEPISVHGTYRSSAVRLFLHPRSTISDEALGRISAVADALAAPVVFPDWK